MITETSAYKRHGVTSVEQRQPLNIPLFELYIYSIYVCLYLKNTSYEIFRHIYTYIHHSQTAPIFNT
jgi:hypothetical protein